MAWLRAGAGIGVIHDFVLPDASDLVPILSEKMRLTRSFWLIRHADDTRVSRLNRFAEALTGAMRAEMQVRCRA